MSNSSKISKRGFASLTPEKRRTIARKGGLRAAELKVSHRFSREEAIAAGKKGKKHGTITNNL